MTYAAFWTRQRPAHDPGKALDEAEAILTGFDHDRKLLSDMAARWDAAKAQRGLSQKRNAGKHSKRRAWADVLSEEASNWDDIPDSRSELVVEGLARDFAFYKDGERVYCVDADTREEIGSLARATFEKRYMKGRVTGQQRR